MLHVHELSGVADLQVEEGNSQHRWWAKTCNSAQGLEGLAAARVMRYVAIINGCFGCCVVFHVIVCTGDICGVAGKVYACRGEVECSWGDFGMALTNRLGRGNGADQCQDG